jgi:hypothetical protein
MSDDSKPGVGPVTDLDKEIYSLPSIDSQLPFVFPKTKYTMTELHGACSHCGTDLRGEVLRGRLVLTEDKKTAHMQAIGLCMHCRLFTRFHYSFHDDRSVSRTAENGSVERWENKPPEIESLPLIGQIVAIVAWPLYLMWAYGKWALKTAFGPIDQNR